MLKRAEEKMQQSGLDEIRRGKAARQNALLDKIFRVTEKSVDMLDETLDSIKVHLAEARAAEDFKAMKYWEGREAAMLNVNARIMGQAMQSLKGAEATEKESWGELVEGLFGPSGRPKTPVEKTSGNPRAKVA